MTAKDREFIQEKIDRLSRRILAMLHRPPTGGNLTKLDALLMERAELEREIENEVALRTNGQG